MHPALDTLVGAGADTGGAEVMEAGGENKGQVAVAGETVGTLCTS